MDKTTQIISGIVVLVLIVGGVLLATSGDDDETETTNTNETSQVAESAPAEEVAAPTSNIVELTQATEDLSTLVTAVVEAELVETLSGEGPFTVFAPLNSGFAALPEGTLENLLLPENQADLADILTFHVVPGKVMSTDLSDGLTATTVQGGELTFSIQDGAVSVNGANVVTADVEATNGVVHIIDAVMLP